MILLLRSRTVRFMSVNSSSGIKRMALLLKSLQEKKINGI